MKSLHQSANSVALLWLDEAEPVWNAANDTNSSDALRQIKEGKIPTRLILTGPRLLIEKLSR